MNGQLLNIALRKLCCHSMRPIGSRRCRFLYRIAFQHIELGFGERHGRPEQHQHIPRHEYRIGGGFAPANPMAAHSHDRHPKTGQVQFAQTEMEAKSRFAQSDRRQSRRTLIFARLRTPPKGSPKKLIALLPEAPYPT